MDDQRLTEWLLAYQRERDASAIEALFDATAPELWRLALRLSRDAADADDLLQTTYLAALESIDRFKPGRPAMGWLVAILTNKARYHRRQAGRWVDPDRLDEPAAPGPAAHLAAAETARALERAVAGLPEIYREVVQLVLGDGLRPAEIAVRLDRSPGTVRTQLHRAVAMLRRALPAGAALPMALLSFESLGLEAVRGVVLERARWGVPKSAAVASTKSGVLLALAAVVATGTVALLWKAPPRHGPPGGEPDGSVGSALLPASFAGADDEGDAGAPERSSGNEGEEQPQVEPVEEPDSPAAWSLPFEFRLGDGEGYSFALGAVVPEHGPYVDSGREPDFWLRDEVTFEARGRSSLAPLGVELYYASEPLSADAHLRALLSLDPERVEWRRTAKFDLASPGSCVVVLRLAAGGFAVVARVNSVWEPEEQRFVRVFHALLSPNEPVFRPANEDTEGTKHRLRLQYLLLAGLSGRTMKRFSERKYVPLEPIEAGGLRLQSDGTDPFADELEERLEEAGRELLEGVKASVKLAVPTREPRPRVHGMLDVLAAARLTADGWHEWVSSFWFSFFSQDAHRQDLEYSNPLRAAEVGLRGDPELSFGEGALVVRSARGALWNLGNATFDELPDPARLPAPARALRGARPADLILVHTQDDDTDRWDQVRVLPPRRDTWFLFQWLPLEDEAWIASFREHRLTTAEELGSGGVLVQLRGSKNATTSRAYFDGVTTGVPGRAPSAELGPIAAGTSDDEVHVQVRGGVLRPGRTWEVTRIEYEAWTGERGGVRVVLEGQVVIDLAPSESVDTGRWQGRVRISDTGLSFVEADGASQCDVRVRGRWVD